MKLLLKMFIALLLVVIAAIVYAETLLEFWWFRSLKLETFFVLREGYAYSVYMTTTVILTLGVFLNFFTIPRVLAQHSGDENKGLLGLLQGHTKLLLLCSLLIAVLVLSPVYAYWERFLLFFYAVPSELSDPVYGKNISYYLFSYPVFEIIQQDLLWFFALLLGLSGFLYFLYYKNKQKLPIAAKLHIAILVTILVAVSILQVVWQWNLIFHL